LAVARVKPLCGRAWLARGVRASGMSGLPLSGLGCRAPTLTVCDLLIMIMGQLASFGLP
jgi:hypothetical protein